MRGLQTIPSEARGFHFDFLAHRQRTPIRRKYETLHTRIASRSTSRCPRSWRAAEILITYILITLPNNALILAVATLIISKNLLNGHSTRPKAFNEP